MQIILATNNRHKLEEIAAAVPNSITIIPLQEAVGELDIPETGTTLEANAAIKAQAIWQRTQRTCMADDTGLEVAALNGEPGVYSARYAGEGCSFQDNIDKLLRELGTNTNRSARFRTVICLIHLGVEHYFEGVVDGEILTQPTGTDGFGYDPIFCPAGYQQSFAQMSLADKNVISHRGKAVQAVVRWLTFTLPS